MCLYTSMINAKVAEDNIICYKIVRDTPETDISVREYKSIWFFFTYKIGGKYHERSFSARSVMDMRFNRDSVLSREVHSGFHSYTDLKDIEEKCRMGWYRDNCTVLKCVIPKGSLYFISNERECTEYCSQDIMVISELRYNGKAGEDVWDEQPRDTKLPEQA